MSEATLYTDLTITMILDEDDFLTHQLYTASKTPRVRNGRIRSWVLTTITFFLLGYLLSDSNKALAGYYFFLLAGLSLIGYPSYSRWRYRRHYLKYIRDTFSGRIDSEATVEFQEDAVIARDNSGEMKLNVSQIEQINEIRDYYFIKIKGAGSLIFPKAKITDLEKLANNIRYLAEKKGISHNVELDWKWR